MKLADGAGSFEVKLQVGGWRLEVWDDVMWRDPDQVGSGCLVGHEKLHGALIDSWDGVRVYYKIQEL